jgi:hypothetical protein
MTLRTARTAVGTGYPMIPGGGTHAVVGWVEETVGVMPDDA